MQYNIKIQTQIVTRGNHCDAKCRHRRYEGLGKYVCSLFGVEIHTHQHVRSVRCSECVSSVRRREFNLDPKGFIAVPSCHGA